MKRSLLDPLPRPLSTTALVALVAFVVAGTGIAVGLFLESEPGLRRANPAVEAAPPAAERALGPDRPESLSQRWSPARPGRSAVVPSGALGAGSSGPGSSGTGPAARPSASDCGGAAPTLFRPPEGS